MWLFSIYGFVSIVKASYTSNPNNHLVRGRIAGHVESVIEAAGLAPRTVSEDAGTDYRFRAEITPDELQQLMLFLANDNKYSNFKSQAAVTMRDKFKAREYLQALHDVWDIGWELQEKAREGSKKVTSFVQSFLSR